MPIEGHYRALFNESLCAFEALRADAELWTQFAECHSIARDLTRLTSALSGRPEQEIFKLAIREYQFAQLAIASAHYRHGFGGLRLSFELMLSALYYSAHEIDCRLWFRGRKDIRWGALLDENSGLFSELFCQAFFPALSSSMKQHKIIAEKVYRECSEFVHGNPSTHEQLPRHIGFDGVMVQSWCARAKLIKQVVLYMYCLCYLRRLDNSALAGIEPVVSEGVGYIAEIREFLGSKNTND